MVDIGSYGLFIIANPIIKYQEDLYFADRCYLDTIEHSRDFVSSALIVARRRNSDLEPKHYLKLLDGNAIFALEIKDYGVGGLIGMKHITNILIEKGLKKSLASLIKAAEFVYIEGGTNIESFLAAQLATKLKRPLILEMRGSTVLNTPYMKNRFGLAGIVMVMIHKWISAYVRSRSLAGLYINKTLMRRYPVAGGYARSISDAYLPLNIKGQPREYIKPASRYLFVGHLEKVKRIDLIISALGLVCDKLPYEWQLDIVGSGPSEEELKREVGQLGIHKHIKFHGSIHWGDSLFSLYRNADLLMVASTTESGPRVMIEAMAFGLPVISTKVGIASDLLGGSELVPIDDKTNYARTLLGLIYDLDRLTAISKTNWGRAQEYREDILAAKRKKFWKEALRLEPKN